MNRSIAELLQHDTPDAIVDTTPDGKVVHWNIEAENVFGYSSAEAIDRHPAKPPSLFYQHDFEAVSGRRDRR